MKELVVNALKDVVSLSEEEISALLETPPNPKLGDYAFPCFTLARKQNKNPKDLAIDIAKKFARKEFAVDSLGPYVNFSINRDLLVISTLDTINKQGDKYGHGKYSRGRTMIEFSGANTHKAFHIGHVKSTSLGESLARILEAAGEKVLRVNYQGDAGMHVARWLWCYQKYHKREKLRKDGGWIASIYADAMRRLVQKPRLQKQADKINAFLESKEDKKINALWEKTRKLSLDALETIYDDLDTHFNEFFFESEMEERGKELAQNLVEKDIARISDGAAIVDLSKYGLAVWVLLRKDGTVLYSAKDLALAEKKFKEYNINRSIYVVGSEQKLHFQQLFKTLELMNFKQVKGCEYISVGLVRLPFGKMSSRTGQNILYSDFKKDIVDYAKAQIKKRHKLTKSSLDKRALAISIAALKYALLKQDPNKTITFKKEDALKFEGDTGPYLLYTYARARSIARKAGNKRKFNKASLRKMAVSDSEKLLASKLVKFPDIVQEAHQKRAANLIANYAYDIAKSFNEFYHTSKVLGTEHEALRLALVNAFAQVLKNSLYLLGISVIERM